MIVMISVVCVMIQQETTTDVRGADWRQNLHLKHTNDHRPISRVLVMA